MLPATNPKEEFHEAEGRAILKKVSRVQEQTISEPGEE
jgi:hypothetical protein